MTMQSGFKFVFPDVYQNITSNGPINLDSYLKEI